MPDRKYCHISVLLSAAAAVLCSVMTGCAVDGDEHPAAETELSFGAAVSDVITGGDTKGYVKGSSLYETDNARSTEQKARDMFVTVHVFPQDGDDSDYFKNEKFSLSDDGYWHHTPALYWPIGSTVDLIAYSSSGPLSDVEYNIENAAASLKAHVEDDRLQDDILFGSSWHETQGRTPFAITMNHSQAWITFSLRRIGPSVTTLDSVVIHDVYTDGMLEVTNNYGDASVKWNFRTSTAADLLVPDVIGNVYGPEAKLPKSPVFLDVLLPEQKKCMFSIVCSMNGEKWRRTVTLSHSNWLMGVHYTYDIDIRADSLGSSSEEFSEEESGW